jgi:hypothetical protein
MFKSIFISIWLIFHPVHVTMTSIDFDQEKNFFTVFVKMNKDDFQKDYKLTLVDTLKTDFSVITSAALNEAGRYLNTNFSLIVNEKTLNGIVKDIKIEENEISFVMEFPNKNKPKTILVKSMIMKRLYNDQSNMIILKVNEFEEGFKLSSELTEKRFNII